MSTLQFLLDIPTVSGVIANHSNHNLADHIKLSHHCFPHSVTAVTASIDVSITIRTVHPEHQGQVSPAGVKVAHYFYHCIVRTVQFCFCTVSDFKSMLVQV